MIKEILEENGSKLNKSKLKGFNLRVKLLKEDIKDSPQDVFGRLESLQGYIEEWAKELREDLAW